MNQTHDPSLRSWVESANAPATDFPIQNLPFGVFSRKGDAAPRVGVAIGDQIVDVTECEKANVWGAEGRDVARLCGDPTLNRVAQSPPEALSRFRARLSELLAGEPDSAEIKPLPARALIPMAEADLHMPVQIGDYTDFYASIYHATNVGRLFRPDNPLLPNYKYVPIGYHGRSSSIVLSGTTVRRPKGQMLAAGASTPSFGLTELLDYEAEIGFFVGRGNALGEPVRIEEAGDHIFGVCLVNDWSARDIQ
ncbi:MAG: fumarylacetoacetate hydrolase family protein, partial [Gemmatimonadota bacterium]|nr:fumarylacetoacetate hydrolase family protein [Gemmatimonadota bacterium]